MSIFDEVMGYDSSVFKNQEIFNINYMPDIVQCRDQELRAIFMNLKPLFTNNKTMNTIIIGNNSTGKTTVIKHALREIEENVAISSCYINCNIQNTIRKCYLQLYKVLFGQSPPRNIGTEIIQESIMEKLEEKSFIIVIDDINSLSKNDSNTLVNQLFRSNEFYHANIAIILIMNDMTFKYSLEKNTQSVLQCQEVIFDDYTQEEMYSILKYRCDLGFKKGIISDDKIRKLSKNVATYTDIRRGLTILNLLGQKIEEENRDEITEKDLEEYLI